jgi:voltage-gated potassium channel
VSSRRDAWFARWLQRKPLTARRASVAIAVATLLVTIISGVLMRILDHREFDNVWLGLWWAVQTVTTVGYGDVTPSNLEGRLVGAFLMLTAIGFLTVITASVTAALIEQVRRRTEDSGDAELHRKLDEVNARLGRLETSLRSTRD